MDITPLLKDLNEPQNQAVTASPKNMLVLAGAGSGKTRVLVHRIAWLIATEQATAHNILAVTFTNKAANEMKARLEHLCPSSTNGMWIGTFHGLCHKMLRYHWQEANLSANFHVMDGDDQLRMIKRIQKELNIDEGKYPPKKTRSYINQNKEHQKRACDLPKGKTPYEQNMIAVYTLYEENCKTAHLIDFTELLLLSYELLAGNETLRIHYQERFAHVLIDEFQDINTIQYAWAKILSSQAHMMAVGDEDQSIYSWRGAKVDFILKFEKDMDAVEVIRLEQNYRSTKTILTAANAVIQNNHHRLGKTLWSDQNQGAPITLYRAYQEYDEANFVAQSITALRLEHDLSNIAILYRSNAQSRLIEEQLIRANIPYRVYGGLRFFERAEIKDALAYLRLGVNPDDDSAFERIINTPTRGIGLSTLEKIRHLARTHHISLWDAAHRACQETIVSGRAQNALHAFFLMFRWFHL